MKKSDCTSKDISIKSLFLGPQAENANWVQESVQKILQRWFQWRATRFPKDGPAVSLQDQSTLDFIDRRQNFEGTLNELLNRFEEELPKFSPRYIGHMFSETSLAALFGHFVALLHNPNNISSESSKVGVMLENEAIQALAEMVQYSNPDGSVVQGHFTSGGTLANLEALFRARNRHSLWLSAELARCAHHQESPQLFRAAHMGWKRFHQINGSQSTSQPSLSELAETLRNQFGIEYHGPIALIPENKHYSWPKGLAILGLNRDAYWPIQLDAEGRLSLAHLKDQLRRAEAETRPVMMVVSVAGTTELGTFDPIDEVSKLLTTYRDERDLHIWHHVDAAYGGYFCSLDRTTLPKATAKAVKGIQDSDSITLDPHKLGYVPYASGSLLIRSSPDYFMSPFGAPYVQFQEGTDRGLFTLEGSRSAAGAVATWMTSKTTGFNPEGYGRILARTLSCRAKLEAALKESGLPVLIIPSADCNILCFSVAHANEPLSAGNERVDLLYQNLAQNKHNPFFVSMTRLKMSHYEALIESFASTHQLLIDSSQLSLIRLCLMNPFFDSVETETDFIHAFIQALQEAIEVPYLKSAES